MGASSEVGRMLTDLRWATLLDGDAELHRHLLVARLAAELLGERHGGAAHLGDLVDEVDGQADGLRLVGQGALDGLFDPPGGVGAELAALARIEALDGLDQADVALADEVEQRQAEILVVMGDLHDQAQVGLDHVIAGGPVAAADAAGELDLLGDRQQRGLGDFLEIELQAAALQGISARPGPAPVLSRNEGGASVVGDGGCSTSTWARAGSPASAAGLGLNLRYGAMVRDDFND